MVTALVLTSAAALTAPGPALHDLRVTNGSVPYLGDWRLLTTVSPNRDGFRDQAVVHFRLQRPATVRLEVVATNMVRAGQGGTTIVWKTARHFAAGAGALTWRPAPGTQPRTYVLRLKVGKHVYGGSGPGGRQDAPVVRVQGIDAGFTKRSYAPGEGPSSGSRPMRACCDCGARLPAPGGRASRTSRPAGSPRPADSSTGTHRDDGAAPGRPRRGLAERPSSARAADGRVGYALHRAATQVGRTVLPSSSRPTPGPPTTSPTATAWPGRPRYHRSAIAASMRARSSTSARLSVNDWDLEFVRAQPTSKSVDSSDDDLGRLQLSRGGAARPRRLPGHEEYVTQHEYDVIEHYRNAGGNLAFCANNFSASTGSPTAQRAAPGESRAARVRIVGVQQSGRITDNGRPGTPSQVWPRRRGRSKAPALSTVTCSVATGSRSTHEPPRPRTASRCSRAFPTCSARDDRRR